MESLRRRGRLLLVAALAGLALTVALLAGVHLGRAWLTRRPTVTLLPPAPGERVDAQAERFARLAGLRPASSRAPTPEVLGNPAADRYPDEAQAAARNPWDLAAFGGRLYVGLGDYGNEGATANAGPVPVYAYDPGTGAFERQTILDEEQIDRFYVFGPQLLVPGTDPRQSWDLGDLYRRDLLGGWYKLRTLPHAIHTLALAEHDGRLFAGVSVTDAVPPGFGKDRYGSAVEVSADGGTSWRVERLGGWRIFDFLQVKGRLYATDIFAGPAVQRWLDEEGREHYYAPVYEARPDGSFGRRPDLTAPVVFPRSSLAGRRAGSIERAVPWHGAAAYIGAFAAKPGEALTRSLYIADDLTPGHVRTRRVALPPSAIVWDLLVDGGRLCVLFAVPDGESAWRSAVWSSADGRHWTEQAAFSAVTFARSFARLGDSFYFGLGSISHPRTPGSTPADLATGTLLRLPAG